jgi:AcrR family transcriptional regulator
MGTPRTKAAQREQMLQTLLQTARKLFAQQGYAQASTEALVREAGVTRGALYHYFPSKEALFRAVLEDVQRSLAERIVSAAGTSEDSWEQLRLGCEAFLAASLERDVQQIMLVDGPSVVGWQEWRRLDAAHSMRLLDEVLAQLIEEGRIQPQPRAALVHLLSGAMNEAALWIAQSEDPARALADATAALGRLLEGLR